MTALIVWASIGAYCVAIVIAARLIYTDFIRETIHMTEEERDREKLRSGFWPMLTTFSIVWPLAIVLILCIGIAEQIGPWCKEHIGKPLSRVITGPGKRMLAEHEGKKREEIIGD